MTTPNVFARSVQHENLNEGMYHILIGKCEGEAYTKVKTVPEGEGILAFCHRHKLFTGMNGQGTSAIAQQPMHPTPPKHEWQVAEALDKWAESLRHLEYMGDALKMTAPSRIATSRRLMVTPRAMLWFETCENQAKRHSAGPDIIAVKFNEFIQEITVAAAIWRLEEITRRGKGNPHGA